MTDVDKAKSIFDLLFDPEVDDYLDATRDEEESWYDQVEKEDEEYLEDRRKARNP